jgi:hypothetical protein
MTTKNGQPQWQNGQTAKTKSTVTTKNSNEKKVVMTKGSNDEK